LDLTVEGDISDFLGVKIDPIEDKKHINLTQPQLIDLILKELHLNGDDVSLKETPLPVGKVIHKYQDSAPFDGHFNYRRIIGRLMYLEKATRPDIAAAVHMLARHAADPRKEHGDMVKWLGRYLKATKDQGMIYRVNTKKSFDVYVDANFSGDWVKDIDQSNDPNSAKSRSGYVIMYHGCPLLWTSKLQSEVALSSTESEVLALSAAAREAIPLMRLLNEIQDMKLIKKARAPTVHCRFFEDNSGAQEICSVSKHRARTKHINTKHFLFRSYVESNQMSIQAIKSEWQPADYLTKSLNALLLQRHRRFVQGW
jgi:hypothetical protein